MANKNVIYTAIFGDYDELRDPEVITDGWDYICFTDSDVIRSNIWKVIKTEKDPNIDSRNMSRKIKILYHKYLPGYDIAIWVDGYSIIKTQLNDFVQTIGSLEKYDIVTLKHPRRRNIYEEANLYMSCYKNNSYGDIKNHIEAYIKEDVPKLIIVATGLLIRKIGNEKTEKHCELWWEETLKHSPQDQISFAYIVWRHRLIDIKQINFYYFNTLFEDGIHRHKTKTV